MKLLNSLKDNNTWKIVELPPNKRVIGCKWVYKTKFNPDGSLDKYKARLVTKGYTQVEGMDYTETFAPVSWMTTLRTLLAWAIYQKWHLHQMDVQNAFLHGDHEEEVYMKIPQGIEITNNTTNKNLFYKLEKTFMVSNKPLGRGSIN